MKKLFKVMVFVVLALVGVGLVWFYFGPTLLAKEAVKLKLNDPDSAQFRNMRRVSLSVVCGELNAKNAMGGYVEYTAFRVRNNTGDLAASASDMDVVFARE